MRRLFKLWFDILLFIPRLLTKMTFSIFNFSKSLETKIDEFSKDIDGFIDNHVDGKDQMIKEVNETVAHEKEVVMQEIQNLEVDEDDLDKRIYLKYCNPKTRVKNPIISHWFEDIPVFHETSEKYKILNDINKKTYQIINHRKEPKISRGNNPLSRWLYKKADSVEEKEFKRLMDQQPALQAQLKEMRERLEKKYNSDDILENLKKNPNGYEADGVIYYNGYARPDINDTPEAEEIITRRKKYENKQTAKRVSKKKKAEDRLIDKFGVENAEKIIDYKKRTRKNYWWDDKRSATRNRPFLLSRKFWNEASLWQGMTKEMLEECLYPPEKVDQTITKNIVREYFYYEEYTNRQKNKSYRFRVVVENDVVVGWKNLD